jgi:predicted nucleic acid-binding protein
MSTENFMSGHHVGPAILDVLDKKENQTDAAVREKPLLYLDTSVISHLEQEEALEKMVQTRMFWEKAKAGEFAIAVSRVTIQEIEQCDAPRRLKLFNHLNEVPHSFFEKTDEIEALAEKFIENHILTAKSIDDCRHIAYSIVHNCDMIVSWNFKHIVNYKTINGVKQITLTAGYKNILIYTPAMILALGKGGDDDS